MGLLLFWNGVTQIPTTSLTRRRYVDDPFYAIAIGNRLPMNPVNGLVNTLEITGAKDGDVTIVRDNNVIKIALFDGDYDVWKYISIDSINFTATNTITTSVTLDNTYRNILADATSGAITITLPNASDTGRQFTIKKIDSSGNAITIDGNGSQTIDGQLTQIITTQYNSMTIVSDGSNWHII